jgi:hypothetical protein
MRFTNILGSTGNSMLENKMESDGFEYQTLIEANAPEIALTEYVQSLKAKTVE